MLPFSMNFSINEALSQNSVMEKNQYISSESNKHCLVISNFYDKVYVACRIAKLNCFEKCFWNIVY